MPEPPRHHTIKMGSVSPPPPPPSEGVERVGRVLLERWRLDELIWSTPTGCLYWATHRTGTRAAIRFLSSDLSADSKRRSLFVDAAAAVQRIGHEGAVRVLDDDTDSDGAAFLVLDLFDATSLREKIDAAKGPFDREEALRIGEGLLEVLAAAHAKGVEHGTLRAEDVFVTGNGRVKVLGFGADAEETANPRRDTSAAGALLFTMLAGRPPRGDSLAAYAVTLDAPVPLPLVEVVDRALGVATVEPWRDAGEMHAAFRAAVRAGHADGADRVPFVPFPVSRDMNPLFSRAAQVRRRRLTSGRFSTGRVTAAVRASRRAQHQQRIRWAIALAAILVLAATLGVSLSAARAPAPPANAAPSPAST